MSKYFNYFPQTLYQLTQNSADIALKLTARFNFEKTFKENTAVSYEYDIQDGDTPEIVAHKYYGDMYQYWIVLFANQILDPQWEWPLSYDAFNAYISDKYPVGGPIDAYSDVHHYEEIITQYDAATQVTTTQTIVIDKPTYDSLMTGTTSYNLPTGTVTVTTDKRGVSYYTYEEELNESNRSINILNSSYVTQLEKQFKSLMNNNGK